MGGRALALVLGKLIGISGATVLALKLRIGTLPTGMDRSQVVGVGALGGIGFTVSLFIADLAFDQQALTDAAKVGIFIGSIVGGTAGALLLRRRTPAARSD